MKLEMGNILIVEDDPFNVELFELILRRIGNFDTISTDDGQRILQILNDGKIDLIIMDVSLDNTYIDEKKVDGILLSRMIKENKNWKSIPIIIVTAYAVEEDINRILKESRAELCFKKPITNYLEFINTIKGLIGK